MEASNNVTREIIRYQPKLEHTMIHLIALSATNRLSTEVLFHVLE